MAVVVIFAASMTAGVFLVGVGYGIHNEFKERSKR